MGFTFTEEHIDRYHSLGFTVFSGIIPASLVGDLRREADLGRARARERHGPQAQRFQPIAAYSLDERPFAAFRELPELRDALSRILGPAVSFADPNLMGVLIEPAEHPWCTRWHRDWRDNAPYLDVREWEAIRLDRAYLNQSNCALYEDHSLWVVPGSHLRGDLPSEAALFPSRPIPEPGPHSGASEERERAVSEYVRSMPRAVQVHLEPGDFCLYRNSLWHLGAYVPYTLRATLHDFIDTPEFLTWRNRMGDDMARRKAEGHPAWEWSRA
jgi:hypothetical protein